MIDKKTLDLARQWAEHVQYGKALDDVQAAADLISSLPDTIVDADTLRKYIADWREGLTTAPRGNYEGEMLDDLEALLPAPPAPRTLADTTEEERAECQWMQAEHEEHGRGIITHIFKKSALMLFSDGRYADPCYIGEIVPLSDLPRLEWPGNEPDDVAAATGGELTTQDVVDECRAVRKERAAPESASPRPDDVPVGEPWQIEIDGGETAIGYRNDPQARLCWLVVHPYDTAHHWLYDDDVTLIARLVPETTEQNDEPVFDPAFTYQDKDGSTWTYYAANNMWICRDSRGWNVRADSVPPTRFGPYTRIEDTNE